LPLNKQIKQSIATILIAGGSGLIGHRLSTLLNEQGHQVRHLSRSPDPHHPFPQFHWDLKAETIDEKAFEGVDCLINLAGAGIAEKRWTPARKKVIIESRTQTNHLLKKYIENGICKASSYLSASAMGYYGDRGNTLLTEDMAPGEGFLAESTQEWEAAIKAVADTGIRTVALRIGLVLSTQGGALEQLLLPLTFRVSTYFGNGRQWYSWIHIDDLANMFIHALNHPEMQGFYNAVGPNPLTNKAFAKTLAQAKPGPVLTLPVPAFLLRIMLGEMATAVLISTKVSVQKIQETGFGYQFPQLGAAFQDLFERKV